MLTPGISVIVCCYNSAERLPDTLKHLAQQQVPSYIPWEVVVVDNASTDNTAEVARAAWKSYNTSTHCYVISETQAGKSYALKKGAEQANYTYTIICDDDNRLNHNYITLAFELMEADKNIGILGGCGIFDPEEPRWADVDKYKESYVNGPQPWVVTDHWVYGAGTVLRIEYYKQMINTGWKPITAGRKGKSLIGGEDVEICLLYHLRGYQITYSDQLKFKHFVPLKRQQMPYIMKLIYWQGYSYVLLEGYFAIINNTTSRLRSTLLKLLYQNLRALISLELQALKKSFSSKEDNISLKRKIEARKGAVAALIAKSGMIVKHQHQLSNWLKGN